jgi:hypothetical protein
MAKYYVESGTIQLVTDADDDRGAALWALHLCLEQVLPICPDDPLTPGEKASGSASEAATSWTERFEPVRRDSDARTPKFMILASYSPNGIS